MKWWSDLWGQIGGQPNDFLRSQRLAYVSTADENMTKLCDVEGTDATCEDIF